jgi:hypothetical protein
MTIQTNERNGTVISGAVTDPDGRLIVVGANGGSVAGLPAGATPLNATSGNQANANAVATLAAAAGKTTYITGFEATSSGATIGAVVLLAISGLLGGTVSYVFAAPAGVLLEATPLIVPFSQPLPASAANTAIVVTLPALGAGNTNAIVTAHGYQL